MSGHGTGEADTPIAPFTPATYVRDNVIGLAAFLLALASTVLILPALGVNSAGTLLVADVLTLIALGAGFLDYRRKAAFYHELHHLTGQLRQACVLPSLIAEPPFLDGKIAYDTASRLAQLSAEETAALRDNEAAYRRYVELWIHEIKTPIAAIKLMLANNPGPESAKVARELERIEAQVDQALYYARSTSVERDYAIREVNLADAAREACKRHSRFLIEKGCTPAFDIPDAMTVLADEPTGALDSRAATVMLEIMEMMNTQMGATIMMVTHDAFAASYTSRVLFIKDGAVFDELRRGDESRDAFFARIMEVVSFLGGEAGHVS